MMTEYSELRAIIFDTLWMARRYAHGRMTFAADTCNRAIDRALKIGIKIEDDLDCGRYADDGMLGKWNPDLQRFEKE